MTTEKQPLFDTTDTTTSYSVECQYCEQRVVIIDCDVLGAEWGYVFCSRCCAEISVCNGALCESEFDSDE